MSTLLSEEQFAAVVEVMASAVRRACVEIEHRPNVHDADAMWFSNEYAKAALRAALPGIERAFWSRLDNEEARMLIARSIGATAGVPNHVERARQVIEACRALGSGDGGRDA